MDEPLPQGLKNTTISPGQAQTGSQRRHTGLMTSLKNSFKRKMSEWNKWIVDHIPELVKRRTTNAFKTFKEKVDSIFQKTRTYKIQKSRTALDNFSEDFEIEASANIDPETFMKEVRGKVLELWDDQLKRGIKAKLILEYVMVRVTDDGEIEDETHFHSFTETILVGTPREEMYTKMTDKILESFSTFLKRGSNWRLRRVVRLSIHTDVFKPMSGSSYIPTPPTLVKKQGIVNIRKQKR